jgi:TatD DNase family protein
MLNLEKYDGDLTALVNATHESGVGKMLNIGVDLESAQAIIDVANQFPHVYASAGLHPSDVKERVPSRDELLHFINQPKVVAIGETGLDYHYNDSGLDEMRESFRLHITLSKETKKPLIIHTRDAREDTIRIMQEEDAASAGGVMHCFTESLEMAEAAMDMGFYISFSGIVTFKNAKELQAVADKVPLERILIETDAPYLTPTPYRGKPNEPQYVRYVAEKIAEIKGVNFDEIAKITTANAEKLFGI